MQPYTVIFIGPQGSGKGTQIEKLDAVLRKKDPTRKVVDVQTGRRFRALAARGESYTERHLSETLETGMLQPHFLSVVLWGDAMVNQVDPECHLLIDGFPRTLEQAKVLESALSFYMRSPLHIVNLDTPEEVVRDRMKKRAREDDTEDSIEERLRWYREETLPVLDFYKERKETVVLDVDGTGSMDEVHSAIVKDLDI